MAALRRAGVHLDTDMTHRRLLVAWYVAERPRDPEEQRRTLTHAVRAAVGSRGTSSMPINAALSTRNAARYPPSAHDVVSALGPIANHARRSLVDRSAGRQRLERWEFE